MKLGTQVEYRTRSGKKQTDTIDCHHNTGQGHRIYRLAKADRWFLRDGLEVA